MSSHANSIVLNPVADASISQITPDITRLNVGTNGKGQSSRALVQFDFSSIPSNAVISSAALTVSVSSVPPTPVNSMFDMRTVQVSWTSNSVTWNNRTSSATWAAAGGVIGSDFSSRVSQTNYFGSSAGNYTFVSNSNLVADVQTWLQNPGTNYGWVMISESQGTAYTVRAISSIEDTAGTPPSLAIQYTVPAAPPTITPSSPANGVFQFSFNAESNRTYAVQYIGGFPGVSWNTLTNFSAVPTATNFVVTDSYTASNRFYRVQTP